MPAPSVDVVILSWHRPQETVRAVQSVLRQRGVAPQVWLVDQGSGPDTVAVLRDLARHQAEVHVIALDRNVGVPEGRNIGIRAGSAPVVVGLDNDVVLDGPDVLARAVQRFADQPGLGALAFRVLDARTRSDDDICGVHPRARSAAEEFPAARFCGAAHALRRRAFEDCGGYDGALFFYWEETDLCRRLLAGGYGVAYTPAVRALHYRSADHRIGWRAGRFYYCVRNRLYLEYCYGTGIPGLAVLAGGYLVQGARNGLVWPAVRGVLGAGLMLLRRRRPRRPLPAATRAYLRAHEGVHGSTLGERLRASVSRLPPDPVW